jgi:hypothetical protein
VTWAGYWLPHLIDWVVGGATAAVVGIAVRRALRQAALAAGLHAVEAARAAQGATQAALGATQAQVGAEAAEQRLGAVEASVAGVLDAVSASLGHRALSDLRFREIERQVNGRGRHASSDHP